MAKIVNEKLFKETPCTCFKINPKEGEIPSNLLCYSEGAIGVLSNRQDKACKHQIILPTPPELEFHLKKFAHMGEIMHVCMKQKEKDKFYSCIAREASKRGFKRSKQK